MEKARSLIRDTVIRYLLITFGSLIGAVALILFMTPFDIAPTGVTGTSVILNALSGAPIGLMVFLLNIPIQILGYRMLPGGWRVIARTIFSVISFSLFVDWLAPALPLSGISDNVLLNALFGGVLFGISGGLTFRAGGTMGGTSTLAFIIQRKRGIPMSAVYLYTDTLVILAIGSVFGWESALYAIVALFVGGVATDYVLEGPSVIRTAVIITDKPQAVADAILQILQRGVTGWEAKGMYTQQERHVLYVTVSRSQVRDLQELVLGVDPKAFMVIGQGHAAYGEGFKRFRGG